MDMKEINGIIGKYTGGKATLEETNAALADTGSKLLVEPGRNDLTADEIANTHVGSVPNKTSGWGLLDMGLGKPTKVRVEHGRVLGGGVGAMEADLYIGGRVYKVQGEKLLG